MAIKKSELYSSLWQSCDELSDASQCKDYVMVKQGMMQELLTGKIRLV